MLDAIIQETERLEAESECLAAAIEQIRCENAKAAECGSQAVRKGRVKSLLTGILGAFRL